MLACVHGLSLLFSIRLQLWTVVFGCLSSEQANCQWIRAYASCNIISTYNIYERHKLINTWITWCAEGGGVKERHLTLLTYTYIMLRLCSTLSHPYHSITAQKCSFILTNNTGIPITMFRYLFRISITQIKLILWWCWTSLPTFLVVCYIYLIFHMYLISVPCS